MARQQQQQRPATADEQTLYARWSGWGATPALFDERPKYAQRFVAERAELLALLGEEGYRAARATTLNAHYTDAAYVQAIWDAVTQLGFTGGTVLEPGCGSGNFLGFAPPGARPVGIEVDPTTAQIVQALYPDAEIRAESFAHTPLPEPGFDLVIGNVPFGSHKLHDPRYNPGREHSIHNHFILKALHATRPGGLVALITSRYTMDGADDAHQHAREQMAGLADLVGAARLPSDAHQVAAGTEVVTDLLIFRRRADGQPAAAPGWLHLRPVELPAARDSVTAETFEVNEYFLDHPQMVLGQQVTDSGRNRPVLTVRASDPGTATAMRAALDRLVPKPAVVLRSPQPQLQEGLFVDEGDGHFSQIRDGRRVRHEPARTQIGELRALIGLRETLLALLDEEAAHRDDTPQMATLRAQLGTRYDAYVARFGAINRFQRSTGTLVDKETGELVETERRTYPKMGGFRDDPFFPYVSALERFDDESGQAEKAEVFTQRVIATPVPVQRVDSPDDAVVVCWDRHNEVRLDVVASLLGLDDPQQARQALGELVYEQPGTGELIRKAEYLSGNVRHKLAAAQQAAQTDPRFEVNVQALQTVVPRDLTPAEISARLGSPWIGADYVQQFLRDILEDDTVQVSNIAARWSVTGGDKKGVLATTVWGTTSRPATDLAENLLNSQTIEITKTVGSGPAKSTVRDTEATAFAQAKAQQLDERFRAWLWEDPDRADTLGRTYNDRFNARVPRSYEGEHIEAPGMSTAFRLHPHQMAAVARIRNTPGVGLFHGTGAGKTLEMIVGGMELVRLGLVSKPCYVVPKGVLGQFRREFLQAYPRAKVLAADSEDLEGDKRRRFVARCSTGDWDAIIISHNAFKKIPVSRAVQADYLNKQLDRLRKHLANAEGADRYTVKDIEKQVATLQEQIEEVLDTPTDAGVEFERTGIGYLFIDEAHVYKNLRVISSIKELTHVGNQITADLDMKLDHLRRTGGRRVVTLATATPIDNSPSEILTMTKYAAPELLADMGIEEDDQYHAAFIQPRRRVEMRPDGSGFQSRTRHTRYVNLPEQKQLMYSWADVKLKEHLDLGEPAIIGGAPEVLAVPASTQLHGHLVQLAARAKQVTSGDPEQRLNNKGELRDDNILWISTDGRTASLDLRLIGDHTDEPQKIDRAADRIIEIWHEHADDVYYRPDGTPEPVRGSLQLVFCDLGVPRSDRWSVYEGLRDELVARGMPAGQIRFAQDAKTRRLKDQLDQDARDGKIAVLVGSRQGLGTGRNIQRRVISVLQLDPTWKLTPVTQSLGRGQRQGNDNDAIHHIFVVTEGSYDPFLWQKVDDKARFTRQMLDPGDDTRVIDAQDKDDDGGQIDPAVMFAVAAGRPELLELHRTEEAVGALRLEQRIWGDEQYTLTATVEQNRRTITGLRSSITDLDAVLARRRDTRGDAFRMTLDATSFDSRAAAGSALVRRLHAAVHADRGRQQVQLGELGGITLSAGIEPGLLGDRALLRLDGIPDSMIELSRRDLDALAAGSSQDQVGLIRKLENRLAGADDLRQRYLDSIDRLQANIDRATTRIGLPFPRQADLDRYTEQLAELHKQLQIIDVASPDQTPDLVATVAAGPTGGRGASGHGTGGPAAGVATAGGRPAAPPAGSARPSGDADRVDATTAGSGAAAGTSPPQLWTVTVTETSDGRPRTTLATAQLVEHEVQASSRDPGARLDRHGDRVTVRDPDGATAYTAAPAELPWRAWQAGEADRVDLGTGAVWHLRLTPDGRFTSSLGSTGDARRALRQAEADGSPVAVADWGVVTVHQQRPVAYVRQDAAIPDVPEVPAAVASTDPDPARPTAAPATATTVQEVLSQAGLSADHQRWLTERLQWLVDEPHVQMVALANDYDHARLVLDDKLDEVFVDAVDASDIDGMALAERYFDDPGRDFRHAFRQTASIELYERARAAAEAATQPDADRADAPAESSPQHDEALPETQRRRRGHPFYPPADILATVPPLYGTDRQPPADKILHLHYFGGSHDFWLAEYDPATGEGFGYANIGDPDTAEWGYVSLPELERINHALVIIERDLYWTPKPASQVKLPGWRADNTPGNAPSPAPAGPATAGDPTDIDPDPRAADPAGRDAAEANTTPNPAALTATSLDLTPTQQAAIDELGKERGEPWSVRREWRIRTFVQVCADDLAELPAETRQALTAEVQDSLTSPAWRERATARRLLDRWSGTPTPLTEAQDRAVDALCMPASSHDMPDAARLGHYGRLTAEEFLTLDPGYRDDIKADLKAIAESGATKTIPRNRSGIGATVRTAADHVVAASNLLHRLGSSLEVPPYRSNEANVGRTVVGLRLNPSDQVQLRGRTVTVERVGIDLQVHLVGGGTLPDSTRRYWLVAAGPDPITDNVAAHGTSTEDPGQDPAAAPAVPATPGNPVAPVADRTVAARRDGPHGAQPSAADGADQPTSQPPPAVAPPTGGPATAVAATSDAAALSVEQRLLNKVAARVPADVVQATGTEDGHPSVLLAFVANGTYGRVTGVDLQRQPITASGYVIEARGLRGGYGGWHPGTVMYVKLGELPDGPVLHTVQTDMQARLTVLDPPRPDMPAGEAAPWLRMSVEEQILAARTALGLTVEVRDGPANELWTVQGCPEQLTGEVARWMFGGQYGSWEGRARPVFRPERVQEAIAAGRIPPEHEPAPPPDVAAPADGDVEARLARLRPYTEPGPQYRRGIAEAVTYAQMKIRAGVDPTGDLLEGEVIAGLRPRADLAVWRSAGTAPAASAPAPPEPQPAWLAGVVVGEETAAGDGQYQVQRRTNRHGTTVYVDARHPQLGMLPRGWIAVAPGHLAEGDAWQIVDQDGTLVGEHTGPYLDAEARLLAATSALDQLLSAQELAELDADADQPAQAQPDPAVSVPDAVTAEPAAPVLGDAAGPTESVPPAVASPTPAEVDATAAPSWSSRIQIVDGASLVVRGTTGAPREEGLRGLLKQHRFRYQRTGGGEWRYAGRQAERAAAIGDVQRWLAAQDRADAARAAKPPTQLPPTDQQRLIIDAYLAGKTIAVQALAGTGKTSTLLMLAGARPAVRIAYVAFNRSIADEAQRKFPRNVRADTSHAFAREGLAGTPLHGKLGKVGQGARWPEDWVRHLGIDGVDGEQPIEPESIARMVMATVRNFRESAADTSSAAHLPAHLPEGVPGLSRAVLEYARAAWQDITDPAGVLLFDHDDYLKVWALGNPRLPYDVIFFDEAQDINPVLRRVIQQQPQQTIVVGDSNQSIYGFRGAVDALKHWPADVTLPLTQSWRFGPAVAEVGNQFLGLLHSPWLLSGNPALASSIGLVDTPDAVLARTNAGAVAAVFDAFDDGRRVALMGGGRAIEEIAKAAKDLQAGRGTKHPDLARFRDWDEVRAYVEDGEDAQSLRAFVWLVDRRGADGLLQMVKELVNEDHTSPEGSPAYDVIVSTVHKAKGREWGQVRIAEDFPQPQENQQTRQVVLPDDEQLRLAYVAVTRAKTRLELGSLSWIDDVAPRPQLTQANTAPAPERGSVAAAVAAASSPDLTPGEKLDALDQLTAEQVRALPPADRGRIITALEAITAGAGPAVAERARALQVSVLPPRPPQPDPAPVPTPQLTPQPATDPPALTDDHHLTDTQRRVAHQVANADTGHSEPTDRLHVYEDLSAPDAAGLPEQVRAALHADSHHIQATGNPRERSAACRLLQRWSGQDARHSKAQREALATVRATSPVALGAARVARYEALSSEEYATLDPVHQQAIVADLSDIAASGTTQTAVRGVVTGHVQDAQRLLRRIGEGAKPFASNAAMVGQGVSPASLNPGDQVGHQGRDVSVERVGLNGTAYLSDGTALADQGRRHTLIAAAPAPTGADGHVGGEIPAHSPYQAGDRVQLHGYAAASSDLGRTGFVGVVRGYLGASILAGTTDDGQPWAEQWGALVAEGAPNPSAVACTCCPTPQRPQVGADTTTSPTRQATAGSDTGVFTPVEKALIGTAVADHAAGYYGGPLGLGRQDAARYTSEGHLRDLVARHGLSQVWEAVAAVIDADPSVLERNEAERTRQRGVREAHAEQLAAAAFVAFKQGDHDRALALIDQAELIDPAYRPGGTEGRPGVDWDQVRQAIIRRRDQSSPADDTAPGSAAQTGRLDAWLATQPERVRDGLPAAARRWIEQQISAIAADRAAIRAVAAAGAPDDLAGVVDRRLADEIRRHEGGRLPEARSGRFFTWYLDQPAVQDALHAFARRAVFDAVRAAAPAGPNSAAPQATGAAATAGSAGPVPGQATAGPAHTVTAAQLARLDTAPGVPVGATGPATARAPRPRTPTGTGRRAGPSV